MRGAVRKDLPANVRQDLPIRFREKTLKHAARSRSDSRRRCRDHPDRRARPDIATSASSPVHHRAGNLHNRRERSSGREGVRVGVAVTAGLVCSSHRRVACTIARRAGRQCSPELEGRAQTASYPGERRALGDSDHVFVATYTHGSEAAGEVTSRAAGRAMAIASTPVPTFRA